MTDWDELLREIGGEREPDPHFDRPAPRWSDEGHRSAPTLPSGNLVYAGQSLEPWSGLRSGDLDPLVEAIEAVAALWNESAEAMRQVLATCAESIVELAAVFEAMSEGLPADVGSAEFERLRRKELHAQIERRHSRQGAGRGLVLGRGSFVPSSGRGRR